MLVESNKFITCTEAAEMMGVSRSTVQRYCNSGVLSQHRTLGGHRRIKFNDVTDWMKTRGSVEGVLLPKLSLSQFQAPTVAKALMSGDHAKLQPLVDEVTAKRKTPAWLFDLIIAPAMWEIGRLWETAEISYADERRATSNLKLFLRHLAGYQQNRIGKHRAVGGTMEGDLAEIASLMIEMTMCTIGIESFHVGTNLPQETLGEVAKQLKANVVWVTYTHIENIEKTIQDNRELYHSLDPEVLLIVGGQALTKSVRREMLFDFTGESMQQLDAFGRKLLLAR